MDVLSDVLRVLRLTGSVFFMGEFSAPWVIEEPDANQLAAFAIPDAECVVLFHILTEGQCLIESKGLPSVSLEAGDVIIFPHGDPHRMSSHAGARAERPQVLLSRSPDGALREIAFGGGGKVTRFVCGYLNCDQKFNPLLASLPNILAVRSRDDYSAVEVIDRNGRRPAAVPQGSSNWLSTTLKFTTHEAKSGRPGNAAMLGRLTELMFVEIIRQYMQQLPEDHRGWLAGLNDPQVGTALRLLHQSPARNWTVEELAHEAAISRSALAQRFTELIGESPMRYLSAWRIQLAKLMLRDYGHTIQQVAARVGYESEAAFNRAFKRAVGLPPAAWRKSAASAAASSGILHPREPADPLAIHMATRP
ncbi:MAG: AraC family transcriptional regulator [Candidatus Acidiferrales bacterium]